MEVEFPVNFVLKYLQSLTKFRTAVYGELGFQTEKLKT